jgi:hypothetical protein
VTDLDTLALAGIPRDALVRLLEEIVQTGPDRMTQKTKRKLHNNRNKAKSLSVRIEKLAREALESAEADPFLGVQKPVYVPLKFPETHTRFVIDPGSPVGSEFASMESLAKRMRKASEHFEEYLRSNGRADLRVDRRVDFILGWILGFINEGFDRWAALSRVLIDAGINVDPDDVRKRASRLRLRNQLGNGEKS